MPLHLDKTGCLFRPDLSFGGKKEYDLIMQDVPLLTAAGKPIMGTGAGKVVLLHKVVEKVRGTFSNFVQNIGDCVSFGGMGAIMATYCCDIAFRGQSEKWMHDISTEWLYGTSRVLVGKRRLGKGDGSVGAWLAKACVEHGVLFRIKYNDKYDLTRYSGARARDWGYNGLPLELEEQADEHPVSGMNPLVRSYEEARDCIANGYAIYVCSNFGYSDRRDAQGFARRSGTWAHCVTPEAIVRGAESRMAKDVRVGDYVEGHDGDLHRVLQKIETSYVGPMARVTATGCGPFEVTAEHPLLVWRPSATGIVFRNELPLEDSLVSGNVAVNATAIANNTSRMSYVAAKDLAKGDYLVCPIQPLPEGPPIVPEWVTTPRTKPPQDLTPSPDMAWLLGLYIADGHAVKRHKVVWTLGIKKDWRRAVSILESIGLSPSVTHKGTYVRVICYGAAMAESFRQWFGVNSPTKRIPGWLMTWDTMEVMKGIRHGDGITVASKGREIVTTTSSTLLSQMFQILLSNGVSPSCLQPELSEGYANRKPTWTIAWTPNPRKNGVCRMEGGMYYMPVRGVEIFEAEQAVVNFEIEGCHSYVANSVVNHNCMYLHGVDDTARPGILQQNSWPESWISGPKRLDQPEGSFWTDAEDIDKQIKSGEAFAIPGLNGFKRTRLPWGLAT